MKRKTKISRKRWPWYRDIAGKYLSRNAERQLPHRPKRSTANHKQLFGCVGGPFDGAKLWLVSTFSPGTRQGHLVASTTTFRLGLWRGRYIFDVLSDIAGNRKVIWEDLP